MSGREQDSPLGNGRGRGFGLRMTGAIVLALGLGVAAWVYGASKGPEEDWSSDPATAQAYKNGMRDTEINFGKTGVLVVEAQEALGRPGVQALLIVGGTALVAGGCFYVARLRERVEEES